jgi:hypothetical protein
MLGLAKKEKGGGRDIYVHEKFYDKYSTYWTSNEAKRISQSNLIIVEATTLLKNNTRHWVRSRPFGQRRNKNISSSGPVITY